MLAGSLVLPAYEWLIFGLLRAYLCTFDLENKLQGMADQSGDLRQVFSLSELTGSIERMFARYYASPYWIKAEISKLNFYPASGHCFPDLVEKQDGRVKAQLRSIIWRDDLFRISQKFEAVTREPLREGIFIMFQAYVKFTSEYGLTLHITDIEPLFTLGEMAREKLVTIERLKKEKLFDRNRQLPLPLLLKRVAVISAETSKGYSDLMVTLAACKAGYKFYTRLYQAVLQGEGAVESIGRQLKQIAMEASEFDAVLIIRGGGDEVGMACYDHYNLAAAVAAFPLPVISGIGHSTNETVVEMVACVNKITPTDVAHFMISLHTAFDERIQAAELLLSQQSMLRLERSEQAFEHLTARFSQQATASLGRAAAGIGYAGLAIRESVNAAVFNHSIALSRYETTLIQQPARNLLHQKVQLNGFQQIIGLHFRHHLSRMQQKLGSLDQQVQLLDPLRVLGRGYTITRVNGKAIAAEFIAEPGTEIETETHSQKFISKINQSNNSVDKK